MPTLSFLFTAATEAQMRMSRPTGPTVVASMISVVLLGLGWAVMDGALALAVADLAYRLPVMASSLFVELGMGHAWLGLGLGVPLVFTGVVALGLMTLGASTGSELAIWGERLAEHS